MDAPEGTVCSAPVGLSVRALHQDDWAEVAHIYAENIEAGLSTFETSVPSWEDFDSTRLRDCRLVAETDGKVVGWAALSPVSPRHCYRGVAELSIYIDATAHGRGIGSSLLRRLIGESESAGIWTLQGTIFPENAASIRLMKKYGFRFVGRRERIAYHRCAWRDTVIFERRSPAVGAESA